MSRIAVFGGRGTDLDLMIVPIIGAKNLSGEDLPTTIHDPPHISGTAMHRPITGLGQPATEVMGFR